MSRDKAVADQQRLYRLVTPAFVQTCLTDLTEATQPAFAKIIRCIVLGNILARRINGQLSQVQRKAELEHFIGQKVRLVAHYYGLYGQEWHELSQGVFTQALADDLANLVKQRISPEKFAALGAEMDEAVHEVLVRIRDQKLIYSFDMALPQWLEKNLVKAAWNQSAYTPGRRDVAEFNDAVIHAGRISQTHIAYESDPAAWELRMDLLLRIRKLDPIGLAILHMRLESKSRHEIAKELKLTPKTVSNRWTDVLNCLRIG